MNGRNFFRGIIILFTSLTIAVFSSAAFAQAQVQNQAQKPVQVPIQKTAQNPVQKAVEKTAPPATDELVFKKRTVEPASGLITGIGGGYFSALGSMGSILKSSWDAKVFVYNNAIGGQALGVGFEGGYSELKDVSNRGGVKFIPTIGYVNLTWNIFGVIDLQPKFGAGLTTMLAKIDNGIKIKNDSTYDFTLAFGFAALKTFLTHYVAGVDYQYYYIFEMAPSKAQAVNFFAGYRL